MNNAPISRRSRGVGIIVTAREYKDGNPILDISDATVLSIVFTSENGATQTETPTLVTDGKDGKMVFVTPLGSEYFDASEMWSAEPFITYADGHYPPVTKATFRVVD